MTIKMIIREEDKTEFTAQYTHFTMRGDLNVWIMHL